jgi:1-acyl-sn-glycerol-3-phosphate acyltransferase
MEPRGITRMFVRGLVNFYYPKITVDGTENIPQDGPVLLCANHANSLMDPVIIGIAVKHPVRFMAKAPLFDAPILGPIMRALGMIPAYRAQDDKKQVKRNLESLDAMAENLTEGTVMGIFPEGKSHDLEAIEQVKSGAARIALSALEKDVDNLKVLVLGLNYEAKERFRSSIHVEISEAIAVKDVLAEHDGEVKPATRALTRLIDRRMKETVVHLEKPEWSPLLDDLDQLVGALDGITRPLSRRKKIADAMNVVLERTPEDAERHAGTIEKHRRKVESAGLTVDSPVFRKRGFSLMLSLIWRTILLIVLSGPAISGAVFHIVPFSLVRGLTHLISPPGKMVISLWRLGLGLPIYLIWYVSASWMFYRYFPVAHAIITISVMPALGVIALYYFYYASGTAKLLIHQIRGLLQRSTLAELRLERESLQQRLADLATSLPREPE